MGEIIEVRGVKVPIGTHEDKKIIIGADHRGYELKNRIYRVLKEQGHEIKDVGTDSPERCNFPEIAKEMGMIISADPYNTVGIGVCGSGSGIIMTTGKYRRVFAAEASTPKKAKNHRRDLNINVIGIGADEATLEEAIEIVEAFLTTPFHEGPSKDEAYLIRYVQNVELEEEIHKT